MAGRKTGSMGRYLYAVISAGERTYGPFGIGGGSVYTISDGVIAAVVSDVSEMEIRPERRNLAAHQEVLGKLMAESTPLPMSFGIVADGPAAVQKILSRNRTAFCEQLQRVADKVEMGLRVTWDVPDIFEYFVLTHSELRAVRDRFFGSRSEPTRADKIEIGRVFERILTADREVHADNVETVLAACCAETKRNSPRNEREVMNVACLVERGKLPEFEQRVFDAAKLFDNSFAFDYNGPWAPHNFVDIRLSPRAGGKRDFRPPPLATASRKGLPNRGGTRNVYRR